jgi:hypothetical protein
LTQPYAHPKFPTYGFAALKNSYLLLLNRVEGPILKVHPIIWQAVTILIHIMLHFSTFVWPRLIHFKISNLWIPCFQNKYFLLPHHLGWESFSQTLLVACVIQGLEIFWLPRSSYELATWKTIEWEGSMCRARSLWWGHYKSKGLHEVIGECGPDSINDIIPEVYPL